eukprot:14165387-Alexandrium_andersonii.AAC.1
MDVHVQPSRRVIAQLHWPATDNMNRAVMGTANTLEAERARPAGPLLERWLARPLTRWGQPVPPT